MTAQSKTVVKSYFESGDRPTQSNFSDLVDSYQDANSNLQALASAGTGTFGLAMLAVATTAAATSLLGGGAVGTQLFACTTTAQAANIVGGGGGSGDMLKAVYDGSSINQQVVGTSATQTLDNKSFVDSTTFIIDNVDPTKKAKFEASGITTATTRTYTLPDSSGTLALTGSTGVTSIATNNGLTGGTITSTGTLGIDTNNSVGVGSYAMCFYAIAGNLTNGSTTAGSNLNFATFQQGGSLNLSGTPSGTWRNVSGVTLNGGGGAVSAVGLFIRTA